MTNQQQRAPLPLGEFVVLMALLSSLAAFSIDAILPALPSVGASLNVTNPNDVQLIVSMVMLGMGIGQLFWGPLCDSKGRKPTLYLGILVFLLGSVLCMTADNLLWMLIGRLTQGFGIGATRVVSSALVRDTFSGRHMSRVMSFVMMVFIIIPMIAPLVGQFIISLSSWQMVFVVIGVMALLTTGWFAIRQPETLLAEKRKPFTFKAVGQAFHEVLTHKVVIAYTLGQGCVFGAFLAYLVASQAIFEQTFNVANEFPMYFAMMAFSFGIGAFLNSRLVIKYGMRKMVYYSLPIYIGLASVLFVVCLFNEGKPALWLFMMLSLPMFFTINIMFTNFNSMAMHLLGHIAGVGAAVVGSLSTMVAVLCSVVVGQRFDGTLTIFFVSYITLGLLTVALTLFAHKACPNLDD
ncbi:multidrug effflux MFS transporter [Paraneptunicella aestuarii]|uniref:multidrug effflux MFS transporter n=1 Tax=Paraneptunicella aestuarii TaxID=2831148 RepID=UPI001E378FF9|nr:multidrug effflux MFS transporter [Paraneptunicella aestuarii]UAA37372.1 multidrug effflux MFS transporter [Paraneptunicella aestuarii]